MKLQKKITETYKVGRAGEGETRFPFMADYSRMLLFRVFAVAVLMSAGFIPIVMYMMAAYEGVEVSPAQAAIFIVQSITTTGYGELLPFQSFPMMLLSIFLMVFGVFMIFMIAGTLMTMLIESRIKPRAPTFTRQNGHVVFTCFNETVARTAGLLERHRIPYVVASEKQEEAVDLIRRGINGVCADPKHNEGLKKLRIERAQLVVATNDDTVNIHITLGVSALCSTPVLAVMENEERAELAYAAGARHVVTLEETLGQQLVDWICADASPTAFLDLLDVEVSPPVLEELKPSIIHIGSQSDFSQQTIGEARFRSLTGATVAAIWNADGTIITPSASTRINESTLIILGPYDNVDRFASFVGGPGPGERVVLVGAGRVGQAAGERLNYAGIYPEVVDMKERSLRFQGNLVVGDATKPGVLRQAKVDKADTLIVTLNDDSMNIFTVLAGRQLNPHINVVSRAVWADAAHRLRQAGVNHTLSESVLGFQLLQAAMVEMRVLPKLTDYVVREITWDGEPVSISELTRRSRGESKIVAVVRDGRVLEPSLELVLQDQDRIVVMGSPEEIEELP